MQLAEQIYQRALSAYRDRNYRNCLTLLDRNWKDLEAYAKDNGLLSKLTEIRQKCRDLVIECQSAPPGKTPSIPRNTRKITRVKRQWRR